MLTFNEKIGIFESVKNFMMPLAGSGRVAFYGDPRAVPVQTNREVEDKKKFTMI